MARATSWRITPPLAAFIRAEASGGIVMLLAAALAMVAANSFFADSYHAFTHLPVGLDIGAYPAIAPLHLWVEDLLMVFFFLLIGMELKREMAEGVLADRTQVVLPFIAAIGGMVVPAAVFLLINRGIPAHQAGWAIASATDIAFALCVLTLAGKHVPPALKIFLLALAIFDDLGAILIIALCYSHELAAGFLLPALAAIAVLFLLNRFRCVRLLPYLITGAALCFCLHHGGIHTTIGGVIVGVAIPLRTGHSPLERCMHLLHPWVSFLILPLFAFTAAGIDLRATELAHVTAPLTLGVAAGLFIGKQVGIFVSSGLMIALGLATLPEQTSWRQFYAVCILAGIGFTMSLFIGALAFTDAALQEQVKLGVLIGSLVSACVGGLMLRMTTRSKAS